MNRLFALVIVIAAAAACKGEQVAADVNCVVVAGPAVDCTVTQTKGKSEIDVCWDFAVECANGATLEAARSCSKVKDGQTSKTTIPADKIKIEGECEGEKKAALTNMTFNGKKNEL